MTREALEEVGEVDVLRKTADFYCTEMEADALSRYFAHVRSARRTPGGGKKPRMKIESLRAAIRRKVKQRQQKKARMLNRRK